MSTIGSLTLCIHNLRLPGRPDARRGGPIIWNRFALRLQPLREHLDNRIRRREDEEDILQSMYASFCIGQREGNASPAPKELWRLLVRITLCKVVNTANRHYAVCRNMKAQRNLAEGSGPNPSHFPLWMLDHVDRGEVAPDEQMIMLEEFDRLLEQLPKKLQLREIVVWKVEGFTNADISQKMGARCVVSSSG